MEEGKGGNKRATTTRDGRSEREVELTWAGAVWASKEKPRERSVGDGQSMTASRRIASQIPGASSNRPERAEPQVEAGKKEGPEATNPRSPGDRDGGRDMRRDVGSRIKQAWPLETWLCLHQTVAAAAAARGMIARVRRRLGWVGLGKLARGERWKKLSVEKEAVTCI